MNKVGKQVSRNDVEKLRSLLISIKSDRYTEDKLTFFVDGDLVLSSLLEENGSVEKAFKHGQKLLDNRINLKIDQISKIPFPLEFHKVSGVYSTGHDRNGSPVLWLRSAIPAPPAEHDDMFVQFMIWRIEEVMFQAKRENRNLVTVVDFKGITLSLGLIRRIALTAKKIYPFSTAAEVYLLNLEPRVAYLVMLVKYIMPKKLRDSIKLVEQDSLLQFISKENFPDYLGGNITGIPKLLAECEAKKLTDKTDGKNDEIEQFFQLMAFSPELTAKGFEFVTALKRFYSQT